MQIAIPTQSAAMLHIDQVRPLAGTGARSSLLSALEARVGESVSLGKVGIGVSRPGILPVGRRGSRAIVSPASSAAWTGMRRHVCVNGERRLPKPPRIETGRL